MKIDSIKDALYGAIGEINEMRSLDDQVPASEDTVLLGPESVLTSIDVVNFLVAAETHLEEKLGVEVDLTDNAGGSEALRSVGALATYISDLLVVQEKEI